MNAPFKLDPHLTTNPPTIHAVLQLVAASFGLAPEVMTGASRTLAHARPRQIAMYLAHTLCAGKSTTQIGQVFHRDHSTVLHAVQLIGERRRTDVDLDAVLRQAERTLRHGVRLGMIDLVEEIERGLLASAGAVAARLRDAMLRDPVTTLARLEAAFPAPDAARERSA